jgi:hypothetical protein
MSTTLSILIPTTPDRGEMFTGLYNELQNQVEYCKTFHPSLGNVQILVDDSVKFLEGGLSIGKKREALVMRAQGKYLCFVDDDDLVSGNYLETLLRLCQNDADVITFRSFCMLKQFLSVVDMSLNHEENEQMNPDFIVRRKPWHICPVRSVYAKMHGFLDISYAEDWDWFGRVLPMCANEVHTNAILHVYRHGDHSESDKITRYLNGDEKLFSK